jgi:hypothetical protein
MARGVCHKPGDVNPAGGVGKSLGPSAARWKRTAWLLKDLASADRRCSSCITLTITGCIIFQQTALQDMFTCISTDSTKLKRLADFTDFGGGGRLASFFSAEIRLKGLFRRRWRLNSAAGRSNRHRHFIYVCHMQ